MQRLVVAGALVAFIPAATELDALAALAIVAVASIGLVAYEAVRFREARARIRHARVAT